MSHPAPDNLVNVDGTFNAGVFSTPFRRLNFDDARRASGVGGRRLIEFQHFAITSERFHISVAIFDTKRIGQAQVSIYDRAAKMKYRHERKMFPWEPTLAETAWEGGCHFKRGTFEITMHNGLNTGAHEIRFHCPARRGLPEVSGAFRCPEPLDTPRAVVCIPFAGGGAMYSQKGLLTAEGTLNVAGETHRFTPATAHALTDFHKGLYPNPLKWNWVTGAGPDGSGGRIAFNLTANQAADPQRYNENWIIHRNTLHRLPAVTFTIGDSADLRQPWRIQDPTGQVDITFHPEVAHSIDLNVLVMRSRYRGPYGRTTGTLRLNDGQTIDVGSCFGMAEDFYLRG